MKTAVMLSAGGGRWQESIDYVVEAERLGVDMVWVAEAWGGDAATVLGNLAAHTETMTIGSGIFQLGVRSPAMTAQTAMTLAYISDNRFILGLGASGPQVMEGLHGVPFAHPLGRMRETIDICEQVFSGDKVEYTGRHFELPLPGGEGKALRVAMRMTEKIPIYLATLSPKMLELTGERADGWIGTSFVPEGASAYFEHLDAGLAKAGKTRSDLDVCQGAEVAFARDEEHLAEMVLERKKGLAFSLGGMGSATTNYYNAAYARQGFADVAAEVQQLWVDGKRDEATTRVPDEMVLATTLIGTEPMVRDRLAVWREVGVDTVRLYPAGDSLDERLDTLGRALDLMPG